MMKWCRLSLCLLVHRLAASRSEPLRPLLHGLSAVIPRVAGGGLSAREACTPPASEREGDGVGARGRYEGREEDERLRERGSGVEVGEGEGARDLESERRVIMARPICGGTCGDEACQSGPGEQAR